MLTRVPGGSWPVVRGPSCLGLAILQIGRGYPNVNLKSDMTMHYSRMSANQKR